MKAQLLRKVRKRFEAIEWQYGLSTGKFVDHLKKEVFYSDIQHFVYKVTLIYIGINQASIYLHKKNKIKESNIYREAIKAKKNAR